MGGWMGGGGRGSNGTDDGLFHPQVRDQRTESTRTNKLIGNCQPPKTFSQCKCTTASMKRCFMHKFAVEKSITVHSTHHKLLLFWLPVAACQILE